MAGRAETHDRRPPCIIERDAQVLTRYHRRMSPASERVKRHRQRRRAGLTVLPIAVDLGAVAEFLIDRGFLEAWDDRDRDAVARALATALDVWARE